jgi:hypothetical protein
MKELLPIALGILVGVGATHTGVAGRARLLFFVVGCLVAGALATWINGELASSVWALFVSFDALQAWLGAVVYVTALRVFGRRSLPEARRP